MERKKVKQEIVDPDQGVNDTGSSSKVPSLLLPKTKEGGSNSAGQCQKYQNSSAFYTDLFKHNKDWNMSKVFEEACEILSRDGAGEEKFKAIARMRYLISEGHIPPVTIEAQLLSKCVEFLKSSKDIPEWQMEAALLLANISWREEGTARGGHGALLVEAGALQPLIQLLSVPQSNVASKAAWTLGNIMAEGPELRDEAVKLGIVTPLVSLAKSSFSMEAAINSAFAMSALLWHRSGCPSVPEEVSRECLPALARLLDMPQRDSKLHLELCTAIEHITFGTPAQMDTVIQAGFLPKLVQLLVHTEDEKVIIPCLGTLANISAGTSAQTRAIVRSFALTPFKKLLNSKNPEIIKKVSYTLSNIIADNPEDLTRVISEGFLPLSVKLLNSGTLSTKKEAIYVILNITSYKKQAQVKLLSECGAIPDLCTLLNNLHEHPEEEEMIEGILEALENILATANESGHVEEVASAIEACGGTEAIERHQTSASESIYEKSFNIIEKYYGFPGSDMEEDEEEVAEVNLEDQDTLPL